MNWRKLSETPKHKNRLIMVADFRKRGSHMKQIGDYYVGTWEECNCWGYGNIRAIEACTHWTYINPPKDD